MHKNKKLLAIIVAAAIWSFLFSFLSFYWAAGGRLGISTLGATIESLSMSPDFIMVVWLSALLKLLAGFVVLALLLELRKYTWSSYLAIPVFAIGIVCAGYGLINIGARVAMALNIIPTPATMQSEAAYWHLFFWDPFWVLGGVLFIAAGLVYKSSHNLHR